ncbi:protein-methionine-sulfoxide reductase heme-binding subunit MsrQ [Roseovarius pelagicus]|uniref:Protein-methionine-sulfoxide reductase heme-binding subunit MsrQ n=1 Tax=Roseovarius pelagicus TaxID=2980108 RepID=A0ABY6D7A7_9RHOB|nr:protein-methionine-sulfoxide reductase heme-binding subunit MsrQ [Roseovarius pelagicus]UXX82034.1 protein-methionine-sulfoxide reductase heme-binding subunit MsrQ [Roseovarius pelagicus]
MVTELINRATRRIPTWSVYVIGLLPIPWLIYMAQTGGLGREPIKGLEHELGELALQLLIAGLCITPLRRYAGLNLIRFRRTLGVLAYSYVSLHLLVWLVLDIGVLSQIGTDILKRPYITIGMAGFVVLTPLAFTSNNWSVRHLGPKWRKLHKLTYLATLLGGLHYVMLAKGLQLEPLLYMSAILMLLALRIRRSPRNQAA